METEIGAIIPESGGQTKKSRADARRRDNKVDADFVAAARLIGYRCVFATWWLRYAVLALLSPRLALVARVVRLC